MVRREMSDWVREERKKERKRERKKQMREMKRKQGRIHGRISRVRLGRSSDAKTARKTPKKQMRYRPTDQRTDTVGYRVACTRLKIKTRKSWCMIKTCKHKIKKMKTGIAQCEKCANLLRNRNVQIANKTWTFPSINFWMKQIKKKVAWIKTKWDKTSPNTAL